MFRYQSLKLRRRVGKPYVSPYFIGTLVTLIYVFFFADFLYHFFPQLYLSRKFADDNIRNFLTLYNLQAVVLMGRKKNKSGEGYTQGIAIVSVHSSDEDKRLVSHLVSYITAVHEPNDLVADAKAQKKLNAFHSKAFTQINGKNRKIIMPEVRQLLLDHYTNDGQQSRRRKRVPVDIDEDQAGGLRRSPRLFGKSGAEVIVSQNIEPYGPGSKQRLRGGEPNRKRRRLAEIDSSDTSQEVPAAAKRK